MGAVFRWIKYIYEWCKNFAPKIGVGGGMPYGAMGGPIGNIWYVNGGHDGVTAGNDANLGTKSSPFLTIRHALDQCIENHDDYIICWNTHHQETVANWPIVVDVSHVHIIGLSGPDGHQATLVPPADTACFEIPLRAGGIDGIEIAGFNLGAGGTHGCIEVDGAAYGLWIHNCVFGHAWTGGGQDGIWFIAMSCCQSNIVENCSFYGTEDGQGLLTQFGISAPADTAHLRQCIIRNNYFSKLTSGAISLLGDVDNCVICDNYIGVGVDALGSAINLGAFATGNLISRNEAGRGSNCAVTCTNNPFQDLSAADEDNDWTSNQWCQDMKEPAPTEAPIISGSGFPYRSPYDQGVQFYVDGDNGSDANDGKSWAKAVQTIGKAIALNNATWVIREYNTIWVRPGVYPEFDLSFPLFCHLIGLGVRGSDTMVEIHPVAGSGPIFTGNSQGTHLANLWLEIEDNDEAIIEATNLNTCLIEDCVFSSAAGATGVIGIRTTAAGGGGRSPEIRRCSFETRDAILGYGMYFEGGFLQNARIHDNDIFADRGIYIAVGSDSQTVIQHNRVMAEVGIGIDDIMGLSYIIDNDIYAPVDAIRHVGGIAHTIRNRVQEGVGVAAWEG